MKFISLKYKLLFFSFAVSLLLTSILSIYEINHTINHYKEMIKEELHTFEKLNKKYFSSHVWSLDYPSIEAVAESKVEEKWIDKIVVSDIQGDIIVEKGEDLRDDSINRLFDLTYFHNDKEILIGKVSYGANIPSFYEMIDDHWTTIFIFNGFLVAIIFISSYLLFYRSVLGRLLTIIEFTQKEELKISKEHERYLPPDKSRRDEISLLIDSLNNRAKNINNEFSKRLAAESNLKEKNRELTREITERKKIEAALKTSEETLFSVLDGIDATVYVSDMKSNDILFMNKYMKNIFGADNIGRKCWRVFRASSAPCGLCTNDKLLDENGEPTGVHTWTTKNPVTDRWYINHDRAIKWTDGKYVRLQIATDITDYKTMESELRQAHKMESIGTLTGGISHDFNNLLGIIIGNAELAIDDTPDWTPAHNNIQEIKTASLRARDVVKQLLSFSRKTEQEQKLLDLCPVIRESLSLIRSSLPSSIEIRLNLPNSCDTILADATQIHQVIINLCTNAAHSMSENGGIMEISVNNSVPVEKIGGKAQNLTYGNYLELTVKDNGSGITPAIREKIFDPYFTTKEVGKGTGMGLAVVHGIIKNHNGYMHVSSEPGEGTTFSIYFPTVAGQPERTSETAADKLLEGAEKILFVDDEKAIVDITKQQLRRIGYTVEAKTDPVEALKLFRENPDNFDLIISDMTMPNMSGVALAEKIKQIRPDMPIIICTGHSSLLNEEIAKTVGISAYAMKPVSKKKIAEIIRDVLHKAKTRRI